MHRRASSLAVIDRGRSEALNKQGSSSLADIPEQQQLGGQPLPLPAANLPMPTFAGLRRRFRPIAIVLALFALTFIVIMRPYINGTSSSSSSDGYVGRYPPSSAGRIPPLDGVVPHHDSNDDSVIHGGAARPVLADPAKDHNKAGHGVNTPPSNGSPLKLTLAEELGAVVAYLTSIGANARIPHSIDPLVPIDAELILGFNTRSSRASAEVAELVRETWEINPVVMFGELRQPTTKRLKRLLDALNLAPEPVIIALDDRDDRSVLKPLIERLTGAAPNSLPILLIGGQSQGSLEDVIAMNTKGDLQRRLQAAGAKLHAGKNKGH